MKVKFGKQPATFDNRTLYFAKYIDKSQFPPLPDVIGHANLFDDRNGWPMFCNDRLGCCVISSMLHQHQLWTRAAGIKEPLFNDAICEATYHKVNGNTLDRGTNMLTSLKYRKKKGIPDLNGFVRKVDAFAYLNKNNFEEILIGLYLFGVVDIGFNVPDYCMRQFEAFQPWSILGNGVMEGGHCVPIIGYDSKTEMLTVVTWGREQLMHKDFFLRYADECYISTTEDYFTEQKKTPEGYNKEQLIRDAKILSA